MKKFDGILLVTDLDATLLKKDKTISEENKRAIEYFMSEGGSFTYITGRIPLGTRPVLEQFTPNIPFGCLNGGGIYDCSKKEMVWSMTLPQSAVELVEFADREFPHMGIELTTNEKVYFCKTNKTVEAHRRMELFPKDWSCSYCEVKEPLAKILFADTEDKMPPFIEAIQKNPKAKDFSFIRSTAEYYELLPKGASKGGLLLRLADMLGIDRSKTIAVGDNENDISMIETAAVGIAVANATEQLKKTADMLTVSNEENAIAKIIEDLDARKINLK